MAAHPRSNPSQEARRLLAEEMQRHVLEVNRIMTELDVDVPVVFAQDKLCLTQQAAAEQLSVSLRTVERMVENGILPSIKIEGRRMVEYGELLRYLARQRGE